VRDAGVDHVDTGFTGNDEIGLGVERLLGASCRIELDWLLLSV
jgi:hypothetical protein